MANWLNINGVKERPVWILSGPLNKRPLENL